MIKLGIVAALLASQAGTPPPQACVPRRQVSDMFIVIAPYFIDAARERCASHLAESSYLRQPAAAALAARIRAFGEGRRTSAAAAIRVIGRHDLPGVREETLVAMMGEAVSGMALSSPTPGVCRDVDAIVDSMGAMTPDQLGRFFAAFMGLAARGSGGSRSNPPICDE